MGLRGVWGRVPSTRASCTGEDKAGPHVLSSVDFTFLHSGARQPPRKGGVPGTDEDPKGQPASHLPSSQPCRTYRKAYSVQRHPVGGGRERGSERGRICISGW